MTKALGAFAAVLAVASPSVAAPKLKLFREIKLNTMIRERDGASPSTHSVQSLAFSPDEKWIAIGVGRHYIPGTSQPMEFRSHVVIIPLEEGKGDVIRLELDTAVAQGSLVWSPNSNILAIHGRHGIECYAIPSGEQCKDWRPDARVSQLIGFIDAEHGLAYASVGDRLKAKLAGAPLKIYTFNFNLAGQIVDVWDAPLRLGVAAVDPDRHLIAVSMDSREPDPLYPVLLYPSKNVIQSWSNVQPFGRPIFAESGKTVCGVDRLVRDSRHASCWDVDTGKKIAEFKGFPAGWPASVSSHASRIMLTHERMVRGATEEYDMRGNVGRVVWDFRADKVVAEWVPVAQATETGMKPPADRITEFGPSVISASGRYLAEGTNGLLRIYELP